MNKKLAVALSGGAVLVLALSGCGDDGNEKLDKWAKTVCDAVQPQAKKIEGANKAIQAQTADNSKPEDVKTTDSKAFQDMSDAYKAIGTAVHEAGAPPVDEGETKQQNAVKELNAISAAYAGLKKQVDGLDTEDQGQFASGLDDVAGELIKLGRSGTDALKKLEEGDVGKAMQKQESCKVAGTAPAAATG
ncbi:small secreted protein [Streptomyces sp. LE64]|uniref:small secreted protein n=1 Tax=Streptomyces sp. LE64 TaxID=3448653 RepID=UPI004042384F